jgi:hypothetical protein
MKTQDIVVGGLALKIGPTPVIHLAEVERHFAGKTIKTREGIAALIEACFYGIRRTRKECQAAGAITLEWLQENVDVESSAALFEAFGAVNLFKSGGESVPGEAPAPETSS